MSSPTRFLIIAGAEKAGTTSLYRYLAAHPDVTPSLRKETDYFRDELPNLQGYLRQFPPSPAPGAVLMESSPGYLAEAEQAAPRIASTVPHAHLIFVLRDPVERLMSSFRFYKSRLHVPEEMTLDDFVGHCMRFDGSGESARQLELNPWHLRALARGRYELLLPCFETRMSRDRILVLGFDELHRDTRAVMTRICKFVGLDDRVFDGYSFTKENAGFSARNRAVQSVALFFNNRFERIWRRNPGLKQRLLLLYKRFNAKQLDTNVRPSADLEQRLLENYRPTYTFLAGRLASGRDRSKSEP